MSFPTVYYITQVIPSCYSAGYAMYVCVSFGACVYRSLGCSKTLIYTGSETDTHAHCIPGRVAGRNDLSYIVNSGKTGSLGWHVMRKGDDWVKKCIEFIV